jgi:hypothetical protein
MIPRRSRSPKIPLLITPTSLAKSHGLRFARELDRPPLQPVGQIACQHHVTLRYTLDACDRFAFHVSENRRDAFADSIDLNDR